MSIIDEIKFELRLAWFQFTLSVIWLAGYFAAIAATKLTNLDAAYVRDMTPITMLIITYWFQRQRSRSATDGSAADNGNGNGNGHPPVLAGAAK